MFGFRRLSDPTKTSAGGADDHQRVIVKDDSSDSVVSDVHDDHVVRQEPQTVREHIREFMEMQQFHIAVVVLVVLDCILVIVELVIDSQVLNEESKCLNSTVSPKEENEVTAANVLHYLSISILSLFMVELIIKIPVFGMDFFHSKLEVFDGFVIITSFVLDVVSLIYEEEFAVMQLIVLLRLWRIVRVVNGVILSVEAQAKKKIEQQKHLRVELEHELEKFRRYCAAQEKEIEVLRNALNQNGIKIEDDFVAEKPKLSLNQLNVVVEVNSADKPEGGGEGGGEGDGGGKGQDTGEKSDVLTLSESQHVNTVQAEYHPNHNTSMA